MCRLWPFHLFLSCLVALALAGITACGHLGASGDGASALPPFNSYTSCAVADFNGDGKLDVVVSYSRIASAPPHPGEVAVYLQDPAHSGSFLAPENYNVGNDPVALAAGDLNGDGKPDLVSVNTILNADGTGSSSVSVLLQDPSHAGQFLSATQYPTGFAPVGVAIGDLNGDGRPDLAVADTTGISILLQSSAAAGQFLPLITIAVGSGGTTGVAIADLNGDGKADIVATGSDLIILMQDPTSPGSFLGPAHYTIGAHRMLSRVRTSIPMDVQMLPSPIWAALTAPWLQAFPFFCRILPARAISCRRPPMQPASALGRSLRRT